MTKGPNRTYWPVAAALAAGACFLFLVQLCVLRENPSALERVPSAAPQSLLQKTVADHNGAGTIGARQLAPKRGSSHDLASMLNQHSAKDIKTMSLAGGGGGFAMRAFTFDSDCVRGPGVSTLGCRPDTVPDDEHYLPDRGHQNTGVIPQGGVVVKEVNFGSIGAMSSDDPDLKLNKDVLVVFYGRVHIKEWDEYKFCATSKDGARIFVDGALLTDFDGKHSASEKCSPRNLMPGWHDVRMDGFQLGDGPNKLLYGSKKVVPGKVPMPSVYELAPRESWDANTGYSIRVYMNFPPLAPLLKMPAIYDETPFAHGKLKEVKFTGLKSFIKGPLLPKVGGVAWDLAGVVRVRLEGKYSFCGASVAGMKLYISNHVMIDKDGAAPVVDCGEVHLGPGAYQIYASGFASLVASAAMTLTYFGPDTKQSPKPLPSVNNAIRPAAKNGFRMFLFEKMPGKGSSSGMGWARPDWQQICNPIDKTKKKETSSPTGCASIMVPDPTRGNPPPPSFCCFTPPVDMKGKPSFEFLIDTIKFYSPLDFTMRAVGFGASGFAYHIYGSVYVDKPGPKNVCITCADGCRAWFDDLLKPKVINDGLKFAPVPMCQPVPLGVGVHPFLLDGFQNKGLAMAVVTMDGQPIHSVDAQLPEDWAAQVGQGAGLKTVHTDQKLTVATSEPNEGLVEAAEAEAKEIHTPEQLSIFEEVLGILDLHESNIQLVRADHTRPTQGAGSVQVQAEDAGSEHHAERGKTAVEGAAAEEKHEDAGAEGEGGDETKKSLESTMAGLQETRAELGKLMHNNGVLSDLATIRPMSEREREEENQKLAHLAPEQVEKELERRLRAAEQAQLKKVQEREKREAARWKKQEDKDLAVGQGGPWGVGTWGKPKPLPKEKDREAEKEGEETESREQLGAADEGDGARRGRSLLYTTETKAGKKDSKGEIHPGFRYPTHKHDVGKTWGNYDLQADTWGDLPHTAKELWKPLPGSWKGGKWHNDNDVWDDKGMPTEVPSYYSDGVREGGKHGEWHDGWLDYWHDFHDDERKVAADGDAWRLVHRDLTTPYITDWKPQFDPDHPDYWRITHGHNPNQWGRWGGKARQNEKEEPFFDNCCGDSRLRPGAYLRSEAQLNYLQSYGDQYRLMMQEHGDLTLFYMGPADERSNGRGGGWTVWSSQTMYKGSPPYRLWMKNDCNLVVVDKGKTELWSSKTAGKGSAGHYCSAILHEDGVITIRDDYLMKEIWRQVPDKDPYYWVTRYKNQPMLKIPMTSSA